ncbi:NYN domain-containing protein [Caenimonas sedimenti]|uniref:NYN domain-containing protein n=1 Tax=Caenimonas sedimenti TaxID=2596921 RepID=A0A562ZRA3_9BURK|nr:NYN domain-containing protein [Caenimonas sedimenti]TWO71122.1 NYN domain-containing protein [Caenimonas sedimenti]
MKSALFVDFDNVFTSLRQLQPGAAERFARHPDVWLRWLTDSLPLPEPHDERARRRVLVRRCYLNPTWYQSYRHAFLRAGFEIVDCPPVTSQGKTSTDIHLVLDAVDLLQHDTGYEEFIVFSADADFTPLLRKLRRHDRRTTVLAIGFPSAAYQASADILIPERLFVGEALYPAAVASDATPSSPATVEPKRAESTATNGTSSVAKAPASAPTTQPLAPPPRVSRPASASELSEIAHLLWQLVDESPVGLSGGQVASRLKTDFPDSLENWNGCSGFRPFFTSLNLARLAWASGSGGRLLDPARHEVEGRPLPDEPDSRWAGEGEVFQVVKEVCSLTKAPMFAPKDMREVLKALSVDLATTPFQLNVTAPRVCEACLSSAGLRVRQRDVTFLIRGMQMNGHVFGQGQDDVGTLGTRLVGQILFLCTREQMVVDQAGELAIRYWVTGERAETKPSLEE